MVFEVPLFEAAEEIGYILHRGDEKDPGPDQGIVFARDGYEIWQLQNAFSAPSTAAFASACTVPVEL